MNPSTSGLLVLALATTLSAQNVTFPSDHTTVPDGYSSQNWFPYSYGIGRFQAVYESWDLHVPAGRQITRIGFRAEPSVLSLGRALQLQVRMGQTDKTADDLDVNYDANWFGSPTSVFGPAVFQLPDLNNPANPNPGGQIVWLTLTTPFTFNPARNLLVEWRVLANNVGGAAFPYDLDLPGALSPIVSGPAGCPHSGNQTPVLSSQPAVVGSTWYEYLASAPANQFVALVVNTPSALTPPYPLQTFVPGIDPACMGQVLPTGALTLSTVTDPWGSATFAVAIPDQRLFNDMTIATQAICFDFFAPGGIVVSNGEQVQVGILPAMSVLWSQGNASATSGNPYPHWGPVTVFAHN